MISTILIIAVFILMCVLMYTKKLSALFALPLMAFLIALIAGIPWNNTVSEEVVIPGMVTLLFVDGPVRLAAAIMTLIFGSILAKIVQLTGIAETMVRKVSELAGDRPLVLGISLSLVLCLLFTSLGGLGSVIMVGSIVIPIMISVGITPITAGCILLIALSTGGIFNLMNWGLYESALSLSVEEIRSFAYFVGGVFVVMNIVFCIIEIKFNGKIFQLGQQKAVSKKSRALWAMPTADTKQNTNFLSMLTPFIPLVLVLIFKFDIIAAFVIAILYAFITTINKNSLKTLTQAVTEGIANSAGAIFLMIGIGMLLKVVMDARVSVLIQPLIASVLPSHPVTYILFFTLLAPLALYRGPLNLWGLGLGIAAIMMDSGKLLPLAIMAALMATGQLQGICDPTNTHNVWTASFTGKDVNDILKKTLPYVWISATIALVIAAFLYF